MEKFTCKHCRNTGTNFKTTCFKSPTKKHELVTQQSKYTCKYCAKTGPTSVFGASCNKSPTKNHELVG